VEWRCFASRCVHESLACPKWIRRTIQGHHITTPHATEHHMAILTKNNGFTIFWRVYAAVISVTEVNLARVPRALEGEAKGGSSG
jgi:hypothetical protein